MGEGMRMQSFHIVRHSLATQPDPSSGQTMRPATVTCRRSSGTPQTTRNTRTSSHQTRRRQPPSCTCLDSAPPAPCTSASQSPFVNVMFVISVLTFRLEPKSVSFPFSLSISSNEKRRTLSGLMSRWRTPFPWRYASPSRLRAGFSP